MISVDLSTRECDGRVVVALRGELDITDAVSVAAALAAVAAREPEIIVDLAGLEFIDCSGVAALARGRTQARHAGGDLRLAAAQQQVLRGSYPHPPDRGFPCPCQRARGGRQRAPVLAGSCAGDREPRPRRRDMIAAGARCCRRVLSAGCPDDR
jgi:anti-sigma B factor antagonist